MIRLFLSNLLSNRLLNSLLRSLLSQSNLRFLDDEMEFLSGLLDWGLGLLVGGNMWGTLAILGVGGNLDLQSGGVLLDNGSDLVDDNLSLSSNLLDGGVSLGQNLLSLGDLGNLLGLLCLFDDLSGLVNCLLGNSLLVEDLLDDVDGVSGLLGGGVNLLQGDNGLLSSSLLGNWTLGLSDLLDNVDGVDLSLGEDLMGGLGDGDVFLG